MTFRFRGGGRGWISEADRRLRSELLVVGVTDINLDPLRPIPEEQDVIAISFGWEPPLIVNEPPDGSEPWEQVLLFTVLNLRYGPALAPDNGKIRLPDLRIEYETANGEAARVDLELATEHYRGDHMSAKSQAGFKIYADSRSFPPDGSYGRSAVFDDHEIEIFSF